MPAIIKINGKPQPDAEEKNHTDTADTKGSQSQRMKVGEFAYRGVDILHLPYDLLG